MFAIKERTPATDSKQTVIDLKYFVNDEQIYQIIILNKFCDSARVYKAARDILKKYKKSPFTLVGGCMAHQTNLLLKDLIMKCPEVEKAIKSATMIATTLGQSVTFRHAVCLKVKVAVDINSITIWVPTKTIWYSNGMDLKQAIYMANYMKLALIAEGNKPFFKRSKTIPRIGRLFNDTSTV